MKIIFEKVRKRVVSDEAQTRTNEATVTVLNLFHVTLMDNKFFSLFFYFYLLV